MIFGNASGLGAGGPNALDFEGRRWEPFFEGDYSRARVIMERLDEEDVPNRLRVPPELPQFKVVIEVMHRWIPKAHEVLATIPGTPSHHDERPRADREPRPD